MLSQSRTMLWLGPRAFSTSSVNCKFLQKIRNRVMDKFNEKYVLEKDLDKRPSQKEIAEKKLPPNTPTLEQRIRRDESSVFSNKDRKGGYLTGPTGTWRDYVKEDDTVGDLVKESTTQLKKEIKLYVEEKKSVEYDNYFHTRPGDAKELWTFNDTITEEIVKDQYVVSADSTWGEGYSWAAFEPSPSKESAVFYGELNTTVPQDGRTERAGYVNVKSVTQRRSFGKFKYLGFEYYDSLELKVRGDGRKYSINIHSDEFWDLHWFDLYQYPLHTRGGPYWQTTVIPFSKFYLTYKGCIQDKQEAFHPDDVTNISISLFDRHNGPFSLEIGSVSLLNQDRPVTEEFAYEKYKAPHANYIGTYF